MRGTRAIVRSDVGRTLGFVDFDNPMSDEQAGRLQGCIQEHFDVPIVINIVPETLVPETLAYLVWNLSNGDEDAFSLVAVCDDFDKAYNHIPLDLQHLMVHNRMYGRDRWAYGHYLITQMEIE